MIREIDEREKRVLFFFFYSWEKKRVKRAERVIEH